MARIIMAHLVETTINPILGFWGLRAEVHAKEDGPV